MKRSLAFFPLIILMAFALGCQDQQALAELEGLRALENVEEQNKVLIRDLIEKWNDRNTDALKELYAPNANYHHPSLGATPISYEKASEMNEVFWQAFPDLTLTIEDLFAEGDKVAARFIGRGTHQGDLGEIPATQKMTEASALQIFHIVDGKIVETWELSDTLGLMQQLGMELRSAAVEE